MSDELDPMEETFTFTGKFGIKVEDCEGTYTNTADTTEEVTRWAREEKRVHELWHSTLESNARVLRDRIKLIPCNVTISPVYRVLKGQTSSKIKWWPVVEA